MQKTHLIKKIISSSFIKFISSFGLIMFNVIIINFSGKDTLGIITSAVSLIVFLSIFTKFGLNHASLKLTSIFFEKNDINKINQLILQTLLISGLISVFISFFLISFSKEIAFEIYQNEKINGVLKIFAITLPFFTLLQLQKSLLKSFRRPELSVLSDMGSILFLVSIMIVFFKIIQIDLTVYRISIFFLFSCLIIFSFLNFILFYIVLKNADIFKKNKFSILNNSLLKTLPDYFSIDLVNFFSVWGPIFLCSFFYDFTKVGSFSSVYWFSYSLKFFPLILNSIYAPDYAINLNNKNLVDQKKLFNQNRNLSIIITLPILLILFVFSKLFLRLILDIDSNEFDIIFKILLISSFLRVIFGPQSLFLNMTNNQKQLKFILIISALLQILIITFCLIYLDLIYLSIGILFSNFVKHLWLRKFLRKKFQL